MDQGAWWATIHGVAKSQTRLSDFCVFEAQRDMGHWKGYKPGQNFLKKQQISWLQHQDKWNWKRDATKRVGQYCLNNAQEFLFLNCSLLREDEQHWTHSPLLFFVPHFGYVLLLSELHFFHLVMLLSHFSRVWLCASPQMAAPRLPCPWDSPGKNTEVGCHFLLQCMKVKSESEVAHSCPTLSDPMDAAYQNPPSMGFSRQEYWSGVPCLLQ